MIKHIFSDMDGTLLNEYGRVSDNNVTTIKKSQIPFTLVSARAPMEMAEAIDRLHLTEPQIAFNGGLIFQKEADNLKILTDDPIDLSAVEEIVKLVQRDFSDVSCTFYDLNNWYSERIDEGTRYETSLTRQDPNIVKFDDVFAQAPTLYKVMLISFGDVKIKDLSAAIENLGFDLSVKQTGRNYLEITSKQAQKSKGIKYIQNLEKLSKGEMAAFGDGHNDLPMFASVGLPIVMDNALDEIKTYGKFITKTNVLDGVAYGIENYLEVK